jgi:hypothetical protein
MNSIAVPFIFAGIFLLVYPWLGLLKAYNENVHIYAPSQHVAIVSMPKVLFSVGGTAGQIAMDGMGAYHSFACLGDPAGDEKKTIMGIAKAGDWTKSLIDKAMNAQKGEEMYDNTKPNTQLSINRVAAPGFMWLVRNYKRVVCIGTGAGIAPIASFLPKPPCEMMILWVGRNFEDTYGALYDHVTSYNNVITIDTKQAPSEENPYSPVAVPSPNGDDSFGILRSVERRRTSVRLGLERPDLPALAKASVELFNAEAVFIISGPKPTFDVCRELWKVGVHAYGATWDS